MSHLPNRVTKPGPVIEYLLHLHKTDKQYPGKGLKVAADRAEQAVKAVLDTEDGRILLDLLEKSTVHFFLPPDADERALDSLNSQRFIPLDLRRIKANEIQSVLDHHSTQHSGTRSGRRTK